MNAYQRHRLSERQDKQKRRARAVRTILAVLILAVLIPTGIEISKQELHYIEGTAILKALKAYYAPYERIEKENRR